MFSNIAVLASVISVVSAMPTSFLDKRAGTSGGKAGVIYNGTNDAYTEFFTGANQVWTYNYWSRPTQGKSFNNKLNFSPMLHGLDSGHTQYWENDLKDIKAEGFKPYGILAFNEPEYNGISVSEAVRGWGQYIQPYKSEYKLISPAVSSSDAGLPWLTQFISSCSGCQIDGAAIHWYGKPNQIDTFKSYIEKVKSEVSMPIWVTEFGFDDVYDPSAASADPSNYTDAKKAAFIKEACKYMEGESRVERYSYFMAYPRVPGSLLNDAGTALSATIGETYNQV